MCNYVDSVALKGSKLVSIIVIVCNKNRNPRYPGLIGWQFIACPCEGTNRLGPRFLHLSCTTKRFWDLSLIETMPFMPLSVTVNSAGAGIRLPEFKFLPSHVHAVQSGPCHSTPEMSARTEDRPWEDTGGRRPPASQGERPPEKPTPLAP